MLPDGNEVLGAGEYCVHLFLYSQARMLPRVLARANKWKASLLKLQYNTPEQKLLNLTKEQARRAMMLCSLLDNARIVAAAYDLDYSEEWLPYVRTCKLCDPRRRARMFGEC